MFRAWAKERHISGRFHSVLFFCLFLPLTLTLSLIHSLTLTCTHARSSHSRSSCSVAFPGEQCPPCACSFTPTDSLLLLPALAFTFTHTSTLPDTQTLSHSLALSRTPPQVFLYRFINHPLVCSLCRSLFLFSFPLSLSLSLSRLQSSVFWRNPQCLSNSTPNSIQSRLRTAIGPTFCKTITRPKIFSLMLSLSMSSIVKTTLSSAKEHFTTNWTSTVSVFFRASFLCICFEKDCL